MTGIFLLIFNSANITLLNTSCLSIIQKNQKIIGILFRNYLNNVHYAIIANGFEIKKAEHFEFGLNIYCKTKDLNHSKRRNM